MCDGREAPPKPLKELIAFLCFGRGQRGAGDRWGNGGRASEGGFLGTACAGGEGSGEGSGEGEAANTARQGLGGVVDTRLLPAAKRAGAVRLLLAGSKVVRITQATPQPAPGQKDTGDEEEDDDDDDDDDENDDDGEYDDDNDGSAARAMLGSPEAKAARKCLRHVHAKWGVAEVHRPPANGTLGHLRKSVGRYGTLRKDAKTRQRLKEKGAEIHPEK
jgi:hypothetical protein